MTAAPPQQSLSERLSGAVVGLRSEIDVSRHVFRDGAAYVVRDPLSFRTHRFDAADYTILARLNETTPLGEIFDGLVTDDILDREDEEDFYAFVLDLHRQGLLALPVNDGDTLYARFKRRRDAERKGKIMGFMFMRVPLFNPNAMLAATSRWFAWIFTPAAFVGWLLLLITAISLAAARWSELTEPALTMLSGDRLFILWMVLIGLKVVHEFGHAYACKIFGGHVPEMGAFFILGTPCAYVDATDSWRFPDPIRRIIVALGGVYFESIVGAMALFVWAFTEPSLLNTVAYQVVVLSTVVTIGFNLNPLMKYDGYYIVSDLFRIPNLRQRSSDALASLARRVALGVREESHDTLSCRVGLAGFGLALAMYKVGLTISICALIATKFYTLGIAMALFYIGTTTMGTLFKMLRYLIAGGHTGVTRVRAIAAFALIAVGVPSVMAFFPYHPSIDAEGRVTLAQETIVRAGASGVLVDHHIEVGSTALEGQTLATVQDHEAQTEIALSQTKLALAEAQYRGASFASGAPDSGTWENRQRESERLNTAIERADAQQIRAPHGGLVASAASLVPGQYVEIGTPIATVVRGRPRGVFFIEESWVSAAGLSAGDKITCRPNRDPSRTLTGLITTISDSATTDLAGTGLTTTEGGTIPVDPASGLSSVPFVRIEVELPLGHELPTQSTLSTRLKGEPVPIGAYFAKRISLFLNALKSEQS